MKRTFIEGRPEGLWLGYSYIIRIERNGYGKNYKHVVAKMTKSGLQPKGESFKINPDKIIGYYAEPLKE